MKRNITFSIKQSEINKKWRLIDAKDKILGRLAGELALILRGKDKPTFSPHMDCGDYVVVINAGSVRLSGKKHKLKMYFRHSGYPGGDKLFTFEEMMKRDPRKVIVQAVAGMLPKGRLGRAIIRNMKVFVDDKHTYANKLK
ncbi:MAG: 50S ribosomal protein L13 [Candidatus Saganbacteria bacterium]|nr:50S ribosomal protein L13 [Candidatus Saganbacteria bacterium]